MRLSDFEIATIKQNTQKIFGDTSEIFLFGSRVDDNKKGGDIDLYIKTQDAQKIFDKKSQFLLSLQDQIGDQKIDIIVSTDPMREIEREAIKTGVKL
jgi:uncharacterized protein